MMPTRRHEKPTSHKKARHLQRKISEDWSMGSSDFINNAADLEAGAADNVEAALAERDDGGSPFSIGLLIHAAQKERESLEAIEQSIETLRLSLDQRRRAIDQQEEILRDLSDSLTQERNQKNATRR
jgi:hypothetical protein